jgi:carboxypeptidase Taq
LPDVKPSTVDDAAAATAVLKHRSITQLRVQKWLDEVRTNRDALGATEQRNFELMERLWVESAGLDEALVEEFSRAQAASTRAWEEAKPNSDFLAWLPHFEEVVRLTRRKGRALGKAFGTSPYQALLGSSSFNPRLRNETVSEVFGDLRAKLPALIKQVTDKQTAEVPPLALPPIPVEMQRRIVQRIARELGLEEQYGRLDESAHPFSTGQRNDVRITTRYKEEDILYALMAVIHETGHALCNHGLPEKWKDQPVGGHQSAWVHESQSLFWEMQIAYRTEFMKFLSPVIKHELAKQGLKTDGPEWSPENLYKLATHVEPSLIRTEADEVTYPAHVIVRHDLEQRLIDGALLPKDVPAAWATGYNDLLGVEVPDHARGCMQDVHWSLGKLGVFPAYIFGALGAAQLMEKLKQDMPDVGEYIRKGDFAPIRAWLADRIYRHGSRYDGEELMARATRKPLSAEAWFNHVRRRYIDTKWQNRSKPSRLLATELRQCDEAPRRRVGGPSAPSRRGR